MARFPSQARRAAAFGAEVRALRKAQRRSASEVARKIPISSSTLSRIETGKSGPPPDEIVARLAIVLDANELRLMHLAGRAIDPEALDHRLLATLTRLVVEQRAGFERLETVVARLAGGAGRS